VPVVSNSSPIIAFERIGELDLLRGIFPALVIPPAVAREIATATAVPSWITVQPLSGGLDPRTVVPDLGAGECEAISLAVEVQARWLVVDDQAARQVAGRIGLPVIGALGILLAAKRRGLARAVGPYLVRLGSAGFFMRRELLEQVLRLANE
jgi:predicted nucleic acid-binding protein